MANLNAKYCPFKSTGSPCNEASCAWWDEKSQQCIVKAAAQKIIGK